MNDEREGEAESKPEEENKPSATHSTSSSSLSGEVFFTFSAFTFDSFIINERKY